MLRLVHAAPGRALRRASSSRSPRACAAPDPQLPKPPPSDPHPPAPAQGLSQGARQRQQQLKGEVVDALEGVALAIKGRLDDLELAAAR
jgi:hypothetical protein